MKKVLICTVLATLISFNSFPLLRGDTTSESGKIAGNELNLDLGPRPIALGGAFIAHVNDYHGTAWNSAGLSQVKDYQLGLMHNIYFQDIALEYLAYAQPLFSGAGLGVNVTYFNFGTFQKINLVNDQPVLAGDFTPTAFNVAAGYGQQITDSLSLGATVKFFYQNIDSSNYSTMALDVGGLYTSSINGLKFGAVVENLGLAIADFNLPIQFKVGTSYSFMPLAKNRLTGLLDVQIPIQDINQASVNLGLEYWYDQLLAGRVGYQIKDQGDLEGLAGLSAGLGVQLDRFVIDYALTMSGDLGLSHQFSLSINNLNGLFMSSDSSNDPSTESSKSVPKTPKTILNKSMSEVDNYVIAKKQFEEEIKEIEHKIELGDLPDIHFENNKARLKHASSRKTLTKLSQSIKDYPNLIVMIEGHADSKGSAKYNISLSKKRAESVKRYLVKKHKIPEERLLVSGYGEYKPANDNVTEQGRSKNRRVEFKVVNYQQVENSVKRSNQ